MTISTKLSTLLSKLPSVQSPDSPEEALEKRGVTRVEYHHNGKVYCVEKVKGGGTRFDLDAVKINQLKANPAALVYIKGSIITTIAFGLGIDTKKASSRRAMSGARRGNAPPQKGSTFSSLYHAATDLTIRPSKNSLKSPGGAPQLYAFLTFDEADLDAFIDDGPAKSKSKTEQLTKNKLTAPPKD